jgi:hypothetical protein
MHCNSDSVCKQRLIAATPAQYNICLISQEGFPFSVIIWVISFQNGSLSPFLIYNLHQGYGVAFFLYPSKNVRQQCKKSKISVKVDCFEVNLWSSFSHHFQLCLCSLFKWFMTSMNIRFMQSTKTDPLPVACKLRLGPDPSNRLGWVWT